VSDVVQQRAPDHGPSPGAGIREQQQAGAAPPAVPPPGERGEPEPEVAPTPEGLVRFLQALFDRRDKIVVRPIETWTENGKKKSRVVHHMVRLEWLSGLTAAGYWASRVNLATQERANLFFGVCPRPKKGCDRAWQIRTVRCLWSDIDHCAPEEAVERCDKAGLPRPSVVVRSGNGAHFYWLLSEPYLIDDAGDPRPVKQDWIEARRADGALILKDNGEPKKYPRNYVAGRQSEGEPKVIHEYLADERTGADSRKKNPLFPSKLSPKAQRVQDVVQGIARQLGGDSTHDLSRLLRLPCTLNRKDERNGKQPVPCTLLECDPDRRYPFAEFERFAALSPDKEKREKVAAVVIKKVKLTPARASRLTDHINRCTVAERGSRSQVDFALCCFCIRKGYQKGEVWQQVQGIGKFAEAGYRYFELTWNNAEDTVRQQIYDRACREVGARPGPQRNGTATQTHAVQPGGGGPGGSPPPPDGSDENHGSADHLPTILTNDRQLRDVTADALDALRRANSPPRLFQRGSNLCRLRVDPDTQAPSLELLEEARLCNALARVADWMRETEKPDGRIKCENVPPPREVVRDVGAMPCYPGIPAIRALVESPTFSQVGDLVIAPGYHPDARLLYHPAAGLTVPPVPERPTADEVQEARRLLVEEVFGDFPFAGDASRAHAVAAAIQPIVRPMIDGPTPLTVFDAPTEGTGKTLCVSCIVVINTGREPEAISEARDEDEWRKRLTATLAEGPTFVVLDNLNRMLDSGALASVLTATTWKDRVLGVSRTLTVPNTATWLSSGNNTRMSRELIRRTLWCRLDSKQDAPWERANFRHPHLLTWVKEHRGTLLWAVLTLVRAWIAAGRPKGTKTLGMFESWAEVMGGVLDVAGIPGLLANAQEFRRAATDQADEWRAFVTAWWAKYAQQSVGVLQLYELAKEQCLLDGVLGDKEGHSQRTRLGWGLRKARERVFGAYRIEYRGEDHSDRAQYGLTPVVCADTANTADTGPVAGPSVDGRPGNGEAVREG
jgi:hypothetical protein